MCDDDGSAGRQGPWKEESSGKLPPPNGSPPTASNALANLSTSTCSSAAQQDAPQPGRGRPPHQLGLGPEAGSSLCGGAHGAEQQRLPWGWQALATPLPHHQRCRRHHRPPPTCPYPAPTTPPASRAPDADPSAVQPDAEHLLPHRPDSPPARPTSVELPCGRRVCIAVAHDGSAARAVHYAAKLLLKGRGDTVDLLHVQQRGCPAPLKQPQLSAGGSQDAARALPPSSVAPAPAPPDGGSDAAISSSASSQGQGDGDAKAAAAAAASTPQHSHKGHPEEGGCAELLERCRQQLLKQSRRCAPNRMQVVCCVLGQAMRAAGNESFGQPSAPSVAASFPCVAGCSLTASQCGCYPPASMPGRTSAPSASRRAPGAGHSGTDTAAQPGRRVPGGLPPLALPP